MSKASLRGTERLTQTVAALARLLDQTMNDIQTLDSEYQEEVGRSSREVERLREASSNWEVERTSLLAECEHARNLVERVKREHEQAMADSDEAAAIALERQISTQVELVGSDVTARWQADRADLTARWEADRAEMTARWETDRATLIAERNRAQQRMADMSAECDALRTELERVRQAPQSAPKPAPDADAIQAEVARVEGQIQAISKIVEDPNTELTVVIRKNVERAELESYLRGLRFRTATT